MKNFAQPNFTVVAIVLCALLGLSLVAFAAKGPCIGGGSGTFGPSTDVSFPNKSETVYTVYFDQNCAGSDENDCTEIYVAGATRKSTTTTTFTGTVNSRTGETIWTQVGEPVTTFEKGKKVC